MVSIFLRYSFCISNLGPSDFHHFGTLKDTIRGRSFADEEELRHNMLEELRRFGKEFNATGIPRLKRSWKN
jgi:hypothetical protein